MADRRFHLRTLLTLLVLAAALPIAAFSAFLVWRSWQQQRAVLDRQNVDLARAISMAVDGEIDKTATALGALAALYPFDGPDIGAARTLALRLLAQHRSWESVLLVAAGGEVLLDTADAAPTARRLESPALARSLARGRAAVSDLTRDPDGSFYVLVAVPVIREGVARGVLAVKLRTAAFSGVLREQSLPSSGVVTLLDGQGLIVARTRNEERYIGQRPSEGFSAAAARMSEGSWRTVMREGVPAYAALSRSPRTGWIVGVGFPARTIDAPIRRSFAQLGAVGLAFLGLGVLLSLLFGRFIGRALASSAAAAARLARGEPLAASSSRILEIDGLAQRLRESAAILEARQRERDQAETERTRALAAEQAARIASERDQARLRVTLASIADAVVTTDTEGRITMLNPVAAALTGWSQEEALGRPLEDVFRIVREGEEEAAHSPVAEALRERRHVAPSAITLRTRDGRAIPIDDSAAAIGTADGGLLGAVLVFRDASERRRAERQRQQLLAQEQEARRRAEEMGRGKDEFIATVSHELRNPLNAILGWVRLLRDASLDEAGRAHGLEVIERNTRLQAQLVDDLLDMSRVVSGKLRLEMRPVDLDKLAAEALDAIRPTAEAKELTLERSGEPGSLPIMGDSDRLHQILWNLLTNAVKFTPRGGRVEVALARSASEATLVVSDSGAGIERGFLPHVFERFRQGASTAAREHAGLGIGLALVRHLVELHGGQVSAESAGPGAGARFTVRLPLIGERALLMHGGLETEAPRADDETPRLDDIAVLVVEDDPDARELIATTLARAGATVAQAASVNAALESLVARPVQVLVSDIAMPAATGYDLIAAVRALPRLRGLPAIALTAYGRAEDREQALTAGFDLHLGKPVEPAALVRAVALLAGRPVGP
jgi:PAS domain S-box-containing protein